MAELSPRTLVTEEEDAFFMRAALAEAEKGRGFTSPNPLVGSVVVRDGKIIGRGAHLRCGESHAEVNALRDVFERKSDACGATIYVTLEPCSTSGRTPPCTELIKRCGLRRAVIGALDPNPKHNGRGVAILSEANIEVKTGVEKDACEKLNLPFFHWITTGRPFVVLKMAMTLDGKIADADGNSQWITGSEARRQVQFLRRSADAILVGAGTLRRDRCSLTARDAAGEVLAGHSLKRFVASTSLDDNAAAQLIKGGGEITAVDLSAPEKWRAFLENLGRNGALMLLIEGGAALAASAVAAHAVDLYEFHIAPKLLGSGCPVLGDFGAAGLSGARQLEFIEINRCGDDIAVAAREKGYF